MRLRLTKDQVLDVDADWRDLYNDHCKTVAEQSALIKRLKTQCTELWSALAARDRERGAACKERDAALEHVRKLSDQLVNPPAGEKELKELQAEVKALRAFRDEVAAAALRFAPWAAL